MISPFEIDPRLTAEALAQQELALCTLLLRDEARWPWVVLVPRVSGAEEVFDLLPGDRARLWAEVEQVSAALKTVTGADKINLAQFGNMCRPLHLHLIARHEGDPLWPGGVVGVDARHPTQEAALPAWWTALMAS